VRATALGVGALAIGELARRLPVAAPGRIRKCACAVVLAAGAVAVVVGSARSSLGVVRRGPPPVTLAMQGRFERWLDARSRELLATAGRLARGARRARLRGRWPRAGRLARSARPPVTIWTSSSKVTRWPWPARWRMRSVACSWSTSASSPRR
jgi:hypothetical protein